MNVEYSSNITISGNNITDNNVGVWLVESSHNILLRNQIEACKDNGIWLAESSNNTIYCNNIRASNTSGILLEAWSEYNVVFENNITDNNIGVWIAFSSNNQFYHNNLTVNTKQVDIHVSGDANFWDNGVEGNYWSEFEERYPNASEVDGSGIWDTPYVIDENNQDNYPLIPEFSPKLLLPLLMVATLLTIIVHRRRQSGNED